MFSDLVDERFDYPDEKSGSGCVWISRYRYWSIGIGDGLFVGTDMNVSKLKTWWKNGGLICRKSVQDCLFDFFCDYLAFFNKRIINSDEKKIQFEIVLFYKVKIFILSYLEKNSEKLIKWQVPEYNPGILAFWLTTFLNILL